MKAKPTTKEQLVYYLLHNISLGTYDNRFLNNLQSMQITNKKPVTTNQADLLDKITLRYAKQLRRKEIDAVEMTNLAWTVPTVTSLPEYTSAFVSVKDDIIEIKSPYKKEFVNEIKDYGMGIVWDRETKTWSGPFCEEVLRKIIHCVDKHYNAIYYCDQIKDIINNLVDYESARYWDPTLVKVNENVFIAGINEALSDAISSITINNELSNIARLVCHGIKVSNELEIELIDKLGNTEEAHNLVEFAISLSPIIDYEKMSTLVYMLELIKCDYVCITESFGSSNKGVSKLIEFLKDKNIEHRYIQKRTNTDLLNPDHLSKYELPVIIHAGLWGAPINLKASKTILLSSSKPIDIK